MTVGRLVGRILPATLLLAVPFLPRDARAACQTTISSAPATNTNSTTASFSFNAGGSIPFGSCPVFQCRLFSGAFIPPWASCTSPKVYSGLTDGTRTFYVRSCTSGGSCDSTPASHTWTVDTVAPDTTITKAPCSPTINTTLTFEFLASETPLRFECSFDGGAYATCTSPHSVGPVSIATHEFRVRAVDLATNTDASPALSTVEVRAP